MARKPTPEVIVSDVNFDEVAIQNDMQMIDEMSAIEAGYSADRDLLNQVLGQHQMASSISKFTTVVSLSKLLYIKENKLYRASKGMKIHDGRELLGTWANFIDSIGMSVGKVDEDLSNLKLFGEDALESMQQIGIGYRELRQYSKLPADERTALIEAAKEGTKDTLLDLAETLIAKHTKEKIDLSNQVSELTQNYEAQGKVLAEKNTVNDKLAMQLNAREQRVAQQTADEIAKALRTQAVTDGFEAEHAIQHKLGATFKALTEHSLDNGGEHQKFMLGLVVQIEMELLKIREDFVLNGVDISTDDTPHWLKPETEEQKKIYAMQQAEWDLKMQSPEWENHPAAIAHKANKLKETVN